MARFKKKNFLKTHRELEILPGEGGKNNPSVSVGLIKKVVSEYFDVEMQGLRSSSRKKSIVWPRQVAIFLARVLTCHSFQSIGKLFNKCHATCIYSVRVVGNAIENNPLVKNQIEFLYTKISMAEKNIF